MERGRLEGEGDHSQEESLSLYILFISTDRREERRKPTTTTGNNLTINLSLYERF